MTKRVLVRVDMDPPDMVEEMKLVIKISEFLQSLGPHEPLFLTSDKDIPDERWRL